MNKYGKRFTDSLSFKFSLQFALFAFIILTAAGIYNYIGKIVNCRNEHKETVSHISEQIIGEIASGTDNSGERLSGYFERMRETFELEYIFYAVYDEQSSKYSFIADTRSYGSGGMTAADIYSDTVRISGYTPLTDEESIVTGNGFVYSAAPVVIDGEITGYIYIGQDISAQEKHIITSTMLFVAIMGVPCAALCVLFIRSGQRRYISRMRRLSENIGEYTRTKEAGVAEQIREREKGDDEIAVLAQQTASMMSELNTHIDRIMTITGELMSANEKAEKFSELARKDAMTGLENKMAFYEKVEKIDAQIQTGKAEFAVIIIDLNYLKRINDQYGHNQGDALIKKLADIISGFFRGCGTYRIGGDEFAVIIEGDRSRAALDLAGKFRALLASGSSEGYWVYPSAAVGCANYRAGQDKVMREVFERADAEMYGNKVQMKANRKD